MVGVILSGMSGASSAEPVDIPHYFFSRAPALAWQVNENFSAVAAAVDDNFVRILSLGAEDERLRTAEARLSATDANLFSMIGNLEGTLGVQPFTSGITLSGPLRVALREGIQFPTSGAAPFGMLTSYQDYNGVRDNALYYGYNTGPNNERVVAKSPMNRD
jgi:hypothetical protein